MAEEKKTTEKIKDEFDKTKTFIHQNNLIDVLCLSDKELERFITKIKKLGMSEKEMLSFLVKNYIKGAIKIKKVTKPVYMIDNGKDTENEDSADE